MCALDVADTVLIAGLVRALVETAATEWAAGVPAPEISIGLLRLASWRAGRYGLGDELIDPVTTRPRPAYVVVEQLLEHAGQALRANGDDDLVARRLAAAAGTRDRRRPPAAGLAGVAVTWPRWCAKPWRVRSAGSRSAHPATATNPAPRRV